MATRLLAEGAASVVAMGYSVYAVAAAEFMAAFYERLFAGGSLTEAVGAGRRRLYQRPHRPSPKGPLALADWVVPVHYRRRDVRFPHLRADPREVSLDDALDRLGERTTAIPDLEPVGSFVGRDGLFYELETAARAQRVVCSTARGARARPSWPRPSGGGWRHRRGGAPRLGHLPLLRARGGLLRP